jgi:hypothetical protein
MIGESTLPRPLSIVLFVPSLLLACAAPDNSSVLSFHSSVKPGMSIVEAVLEGDRAQEDDADFLVSAHDCPGSYVELGRSFELPHIRITEHLPVSNPSSLPG